MQLSLAVVKRVKLVDSTNQKVSSNTRFILILTNFKFEMENWEKRWKKLRDSNSLKVLKAIAKGKTRFSEIKMYTG